MRPNKCYRNLSRTAYTRREFIPKAKIIPLIRKFSIGNIKESFNTSLKLIALKDVQIGENALESIRVILTRDMSLIGEGNYSILIKPYPFHYVREHGLIGVGKAERIVKGMRHSFGKPQQQLARVKKGQEVVIIKVIDDPIAIQLAKRTLEKITKKLPKDYRIVFEGDQNKYIKQVILPQRVKRKKETSIMKSSTPEVKEEEKKKPKKEEKKMRYRSWE